MKLNSAVIYTTAPAIQGAQEYVDGISAAEIRTGITASPVSINLPVNITWDIQNDVSSDVTTKIVYAYNNGKTVTQTPEFDDNSLFFTNPVHSLTTTDLVSSVTVTFYRAYAAPLVRQYTLNALLPSLANWCADINLLAAYQTGDRVVMTLDLTSLSATTFISADA